MRLLIGKGIYPDQLYTLRKQGIKVHIYDRARAFRPIGAGLTLSPNGLRSLEAIDPDVAQQLKRQGSQIKRFKIRTSGRGWPIITLHMTALFVALSSSNCFCKTRNDLFTAGYWRLAEKRF